MKLAYLIVTFNGEEYIENLLNSIPIKKNIVVIDNHSTDRTVHIVKEYDITVLKNEINKGYGAAINQGIFYLQRKGYTHVFILNQDIILQQFYIQEEDLKRYSVIQPLILLPNGNINVYELIMNVFGYVYPIDFNQPKRRNVIRKEITFFSGAACIFNIKKYQQIGPFDEELFLYYEDIDYAFRILLQREKILFDPSLIVKHQYKNVIKNKGKKKFLSKNRKIIVNRYFIDTWRKMIFVRKRDQESNRFSEKEREYIVSILKKHLVLGFFTRQIPFLQRFCINSLFVPYSFFIKLFL